MKKFIGLILSLALVTTANAKTAKAGKSKRKPTSAETALLIGDSHTVMSFGETLVKTIPGLARYAVAGSAANDWLEDKICPRTETCPLTFGYATPEGSFSGAPPANFPGLKEILSRSPAKTIVIALGTNDASQRCHESPAKSLAPIDGMLKLAKGRACYWVGPPTYTKGPVIRDCGDDYKKFVDGLKKTVEAASCRFIDSREFVDPANHRAMEANYPDEIHFDDRLGEFWAEQVRGALTK